MSLLYEINPYYGGFKIWISQVFVLKEHRNKGVLRKLIEFIQRIQKENPLVKKIELGVAYENLAAQKAYLKCGMKDENLEYYINEPDID